MGELMRVQAALQRELVQRLEGSYRATGVASGVQGTSTQVQPSAAKCTVHAIVSASLPGPNRMG